jgi:hypothetical protein
VLASSTVIWNRPLTCPIPSPQELRNKIRPVGCEMPDRDITMTAGSSPVGRTSPSAAGVEHVVRPVGTENDWAFLCRGTW